jgi:methylthioribose-1-phosphate isomerase
LSLSSGDQIPIEERSPEEITFLHGLRLAPEKVKVANPAFDITHHRYISAIITEKGVVKKPYKTSLKNLFRES